MKYLLSMVLLLVLTGCGETDRNQQSCEAGVIIFTTNRGAQYIIKDDNGRAIPCKPRLQTSTITEGH